jgi:S-adenosylmethionine:tRNA ribosyltransferase-isomerase
MDPRLISIEDYDYALPVDRIAAYPKGNRSDSKLVIYRDDKIAGDIFHNLPALLPEGSLIVFNDARVVEARIIFQKPTGAKIEIFCLEPGSHHSDPAIALASHGSVLWKCLVGNAASWNPDLILEKQIDSYSLKAQMVRREADHFLVKLSWAPEELSFAEILHKAGLIPLPPYIKRKTEATDAERYQTVYAHQAGSVAAPTAGLHFTEEILNELSEKKIRKDFVTLHVGAGTFKPVKTPTMNDHEMHAEFIEIKLSLVENLYNNIGNPIIAVGTTSLRTLESIFWIGRKILDNENISPEELSIQQWEPYELKKTVSTREALSATIKWIKKNALQSLITKTSLIIVPSYKFRIVDILITNFHQPRSTLLLLVAAFIGEKWKEVYDYALKNNFRFLSYGDACLFFRH